MAHRRSLACARDDKKERVVVRRGRLLEERAVAGGEGGCWRKGRLLEEKAVAGGKGGCSKERALSKGAGRLFHQQLPLSIKS